MKVTVYIKDNLLIPYASEDIDRVDTLNKKAVYSVELNTMDTRSLLQNKALHLYFTKVARELNERGHKIDNSINLNLSWTMERVKELIWKEFQFVVLQKKSTRLLKKSEMTKIYDHMNLYLGETFGFNVEFPNREQLENKN